MKDSPDRIHYSLLKLLDRLEKHMEESPESKSEYYAKKKGEVKPAYTEDVLDVRASEIATIYYDEKTSKNVPAIAPARSLREHILSISLYPNVYNKRYLEKSIGSE